MWLLKIHDSVSFKLIAIHSPPRPDLCDHIPYKRTIVSYQCGVYVRYLVVKDWSFTDSQYGAFSTPESRNEFIKAIKILDNDPRIDIIGCTVGYCVNYMDMMQEYATKTAVIMSSIVAGRAMRPILGTTPGLLPTSGKIEKKEEKKSQPRRYLIITANEDTFIPLLMTPAQYAEADDSRTKMHKENIQQYFDNK